MSSPILWIKDLALTANTVTQMLAQDPAHFAVQLARRLPKKWLKVSTVKSTKGDQEPRCLCQESNGRFILGKPSQWRALKWFLDDLPERAFDDLEAINYEGDIAKELGVILGGLGPEDTKGITAARAWLARGELTRALTELPADHRLARKTSSELALYQLDGRLDAYRRPKLSPKSDKPRVLFILTNSKPYTQSGYTARSHAILKSLVNAGVEVLAVTRIGYPVTIGQPGKPLVQTIDGVTYRRLPVAKLPVELDARLQQQVKLIAKIIEDFRPNLLHTTTDLTNALVTQALAETYQLPWVYEMRGQLELTWIAARPASIQPAAASSERVKLWRAKDAELAKNADQVVVLSGVQRDEMISRGVLGSKILELPNGVSDSLAKREPITPANARSKLGLSREGFWVGSVTSVVGYEGLGTLVEAVSLARSAGHDIRCAIVGDGVARPGLLARVTELGLDKVFVFPGRVSATEALNWYEALDAFVIPRMDTPVCRAVTPLKPWTALALGRPVIASDLPALRELERKSSAVRFVQPDNPTALAEALVAESVDQGTSSKPAINALGLTWTQLVQDLISKYSRLMTV